MHRQALLRITAQIISSASKRSLSATPLSHESYHKQQFQPGTKLFNEMVTIASTTYQNPYDTILHAAHESNKMYVLRSEDQPRSIVCCTLMDFGGEVTLLDDKRKTPSVYITFAMANEDFKGSGLIRNLFEQVRHEMQERKQGKLDLPALVYLVTVTPAVIYLTDEVFSMMVPSFKDNNRATFTDEEWHITDQIRKLRDWPTIERSPTANPFVQRGIMKSRYNEDERMRIEKIIEGTNCKTFNELKIDETRGDRLLRYGFI